MTVSTFSFTKKDTLAMKGFAILLLFFHHCFLEKERFAGYEFSFAPFSEGMFLHIAAFFKVCVGIFVFISAYGITVNYYNMEAKGQFTGREISHSVLVRIWRILTGFWPAYLLCSLGNLLICPESFQAYEGNMGYVLIDFLGLAKLFHTPTLMGTWWYLSLAIIQVILMPLLFMAYRRLGGFWLLSFCLILPIALGLEATDAVRWLGVMALGTWFAGEDVFGKIETYPFHQNSQINRVMRFGFCLSVLIVSYFWKISSLGKLSAAFTEVLCTGAVVVFAYFWLIHLPGVVHILSLLGTYSMNMFLIHSFIRIRWLKDFTYSFPHWSMIWGVLLLDSLLLAMLLELVKKLVHYPRIVKIL